MRHTWHPWLRTSRPPLLPLILSLVTLVASATHRNPKLEKKHGETQRLGSKSNLYCVEARNIMEHAGGIPPLCCFVFLGNETIIAASLLCLHPIFGKCICSDQAAGHIAGAKFNTEMNRRENHEKSSASLAIYPCKLDLQGHLNTCKFFHPHPTKTRSLHFRSNNLTGGHETRNLWQVWTLDLFCVLQLFRFLTLAAPSWAWHQLLTFSTFHAPSFTMKNLRI